MSDLLRLQAVIGASTRLRDEALRSVLGRWPGPVSAHLEPDDLGRRLFDLDTPSLFGDSALLLIRGGGDWFVRHADALLPHLGRELGAAPCVLSSAELDGRSALARAFVKAKAVIAADGPDPRSLPGWLAARIQAHPCGCRDAGEIANTLIQALGHDVDALLNAIDLLAAWAGDEPLAAEGARGLFSGSAERPLYELTDALGRGDARRAMRLFHAVGDDPRATAERVMATIVGDLRRQLACVETANDDDANRWSGGRGNLHYVRQRAKATGRASLLRLLSGAFQTQRALRSGGAQVELLIELYLLNAQKVLRPRGTARG
jgi:DNA polymerase III delta subunit